MDEVIRIGNRFLMKIRSLPLLGHIAFGVIDRGTNVLQVRPTTLCPLNCLFCSVDAGPRTRFRQTEYIVDRSHLVKWVEAVARYKGDVLEALIDGVGDPLTYPEIVELVRDLKKIVPRVALETHGANLTKDLALKLVDVGLDRINLSIDTLNPEKARYLQGASWFDVLRVKEIAEFIVRETPIDIHLTPLWIPGVNDRDIEEIIEWGLRIGVGKKYPPFGIQKYVRHKYGRKIKGVREVSWEEFRKFLENLELKYGVPLLWDKMDFGFRRSVKVPEKYHVGEVIEVEVRGPGWLWGELLAVDTEWSRVITVVGADYAPPKKKLKVRILRCKDNIYVARRI